MGSLWSFQYLIKKHISWPGKKEADVSSEGVVERTLNAGKEFSWVSDCFKYQNYSFLHSVWKIKTIKSGTLTHWVHLLIFLFCCLQVLNIKSNVLCGNWKKVHWIKWTLSTVWEILNLRSETKLLSPPGTPYRKHIALASMKIFKTK